MAAPKKATANDRCPHCGQRLPSKRPMLPVMPVTHYALERLYRVKRRNGGFV